MLTWKTSKNVKDKSSPRGIFLEKAEQVQSPHFDEELAILEEMSINVLVKLTAQTEFD